MQIFSLYIRAFDHIRLTLLNWDSHLLGNKNLRKNKIKHEWFFLNKLGQCVT